MLTHKGTKTIITNRLKLRQFTLDDTQAMFNNWANDERVTKYVTWRPHGKIDVTKYVLKEWVTSYNDKSIYNWAIEYRSQLIGSISAVRIDELLESADIGYCMSVDYWNLGIMTEACRAVIDFLFGECGFHRLSACHAYPNIGSGRVMQKCGMTFEGTFRDKAKLHDGCYTDISYYSILKSEWQNNTKSKNKPSFASLKAKA